MGLNIAGGLCFKIDWACRKKLRLCSYLNLLLKDCFGRLILGGGKA